MVENNRAKGLEATTRARAAQYGVDTLALDVLKIRKDEAKIPLVIERLKIYIVDVIKNKDELYTKLVQAIEIVLDGKEKMPNNIVAGLEELKTALELMEEEPEVVEIETLNSDIAKSILVFINERFTE